MQVSRLLTALQLKRVSTRRALEDAWALDPTFLLKEVTLWIRKEHHAALQRGWPFLDAVAAGQRAGEGERGGQVGARQVSGRKAGVEDEEGGGGGGNEVMRRQDEFASGTDSGEESE